jgi:hypothetical protein
MLFIFPLLLFVSSFLFAFAVCTQLFDPIISVFLFQIVLLTSSIILIQYARTNRVNNNFAYYIIFLMVLVQFTLPLVYSFVDGPAFMIWTTDAYDHHIDNAEIVSDYINNFGKLPQWDNPYQKLYFSNWWIGLFYAVFGASPYITAIATSIFRIPTSYLVYKSAYLLSRNKSHASIALIIYSFSPTVILYTMQYYKDFIVHFFVALFLFFLIKSRSNLIFLLLSFFPMYILFNERFYLALIFSVVLSAVVFTSSLSIKLKFFLLSVPFFIFIFYVNRYFPSGGLQNVIEALYELQESHNLDSSVTPTTNIFIDFLRAAFTPFFSSHKVENYIWFDSLLVFGGFVHQFVMILYFTSLWMYRKFKFLLALNLSTLLLLLLIGLIFPYNGRARDSLYPLISITAAFCIAPQRSNRPHIIKSVET